jgi:hypothetical protein
MQNHETQRRDQPVTSKFSTGQLVATPNALQQLLYNDIQTALGRHTAGDWGDLDDYDRQQNEFALKFGLRVCSKYRSSKGVKFYILTECDRSVTTIFLPGEY